MASLLRKCMQSKVISVGLCKSQYNLIRKTINISTAGVSRRDMSTADSFFFRQLFDGTSFTYTYLIADNKTKDAMLIDPVIDQVERDVQLIKELEFNLVYAANTHVHADHITGTGKLKSFIPTCKSVISQESGATADKYVENGEIIKVGSHEIEVRCTPGHTDGCVTYVCHDQGIAFTGDALLIRGCGRTDFQQGDSERLYNSIHSQIFSLPDHFKLYPAHDYKGQTVTTVKEEKAYNPRLTKSKEEFMELMANLKLAYPKMIDKAVPANMICGLYDIDEKSISR